MTYEGVDSIMQTNEPVDQSNNNLSKTQQNFNPVKWFKNTNKNVAKQLYNRSSI